MNNQRNFFLFIIATIAVLGVGLILPSPLSLGISVVYFAVIAWLQPKWVVPLLILYYPLRPFLVEINDGLKLAGDIAIIVLVARVIWTSWIEKDWKSIFQLEIYEWAYLLFCVLGAISAFLTGVSPTAIIFQLRKFLMMYLLFYGLKRLAWTREDIITIAKVVIGVGILLSLHGFIELLSQRQWLLPQTWKEGYVSPTNANRIYGLIGNPNSLGLYMVIAIIASLMLLRESAKKLYFFPLTLFIGILLLTYSRGTWIGIVVAGALFVFLSRNWKVVKQIVIAAVAGYLIVFLPISSLHGWIASGPNGINLSENGGDGGGGIGDRFSSSFDEEQVARSSESGRLFFIEKGFEVFMDHPIIGTGFGTFGDSAALVYSSPIYEDYGLAGIYDYKGKDFYSDNQYIQIIAQTGAIGVVLFAVFLLNMVYRIWTIRQTHPAQVHVFVSLWLFICMVGVVYNIWENQVFPMFFFALLAWMETIKHGRTKTVPGTN
ncbi:O-antigen ligase family protein [Radiobacillus deserti]|uniref:O-antigen ligase family protein n=1 Tax=Radiobacillus deserti TaxID=2594883 RepID=A0A516KJN8_9BACI|nr:O-antigen ligase family protein [Radiobacillus deserti]QDP41597.1 O-antigen ligase family protein [Radiobacillus deserti]